MSQSNRQSGWWLWSINPLSLSLWPLSLIFCLLTFIRRRLYQWQWLKSSRISAPVIVVGNISVGGNGKTPVVQALVNWLQQKGYQPGILTRGYKSDLQQSTLVLNDGKLNDQAGDEANNAFGIMSMSDRHWR